MNDLSPKDDIGVDLAQSGLVPSDLNARSIENPERAATSTPFTVQGYTIPYFDIDGNSIAFYRVRLFDFDPKYKQPKETSSHLYFPKNFRSIADSSDFILLTEGEKKAVAATKLGFPCVAVGGVDAWRNRVISLPGDSELSQNKGKIVTKLPATTNTEAVTSSLAIGFQELVDYLIKYKKSLVIIYDTDSKEGVKPQVQRAAASLGFELRFRGVEFDKIRQLILPVYNDTPEGKVGLDDYFAYHSTEDFAKLLQIILDARSSFPKHPNIRDYINNRLNRANLPRKEVQAIAMAILSELDSDGMRLFSTTEKAMYYFNINDKKLVQAQFSSAHSDGMNTTSFEQYLYRKFGVGPADRQLNSWIASQFTGEPPIDEVVPYRVMTLDRKSDKIVYQVSDSHYITVSADKDIDSPDLPGLEVYDNGEGGIMFESGHVEPLDLAKVLEHYAELTKEPSKCWWAEVLDNVRLKDRNKSKYIVALLFYISPWLRRWRGTQLPVEMVLGEAGSGKSTLCELRLDILTGQPRLRNAPQDMKDWTASITNTGGLHVTDNLQLGDKNLRQKMSDELCRLVTEPSPSVEARKLYSNNELIQLPVTCSFAITSIQQPFTQADILQRGIIIELDKAEALLEGNLTYDSTWHRQQLQRFGGREAWVAHHLLTLHRFLVLAREKWDRRYQAKHRLINLEQIFMLMAEVFELDNRWIPHFLSGMADKAISESDWTFEGIQAFTDLVKHHHKWEQAIYAQDIVDWCKNQEEFKQCELLVNTRRLGRYLRAHRTPVAQICGLVESGSTNNRVKYKVLKPKSNLT